MAIVIPDLFGAFRKGREYAIDRNWKDLQNYEAVEKARNENDLGALNLLERRVMFAPKMGMYMGNADMSARNNALGGAAFSGLMAKTQAQSELDTAKSLVDRRNIPTIMGAYENSLRTSAETANTESAIKNAENAETRKVAEKIGKMNANIRYATTDLERQRAENALLNEAQINEVVRERLKTEIENARLNNSNIASAARQLGYSIDYMQKIAQLVGANIEYQDNALQLQQPPGQRNNPAVVDNATISPIASQYYQSLMTGIDFETGQPLTGIKADLYIRELNSPQYKQGAINSLTQGNFDESMIRGGRILANYYSNGTPTTNNINIVGANPNNAGNNPAGNNPPANAGNNPPAEVANTDPNFVVLFGRRIPTSEIGNYTIGQDQLGQALLGRGMTTANGIPYYIGGKTAVSPSQWYIGDANTQAFPLTGEQWASMQQGGTVPVLLTLPNNKFQQVLINPDLAQKAGIPSYQVLTIDKLNALLQAQGQ